MNVELTKRQRAIIRDLALKAYERDMRKLIEPLAEAFQQWRAGKLDTWRLAERYETNSIAPMIVAYAYVVGLLREEEVPAEIKTTLAKAISFYRRGIADGSVSMDEQD